MSMLAGITRGKIERPHFILIYGVDGVGKTTIAADAPDPVFLGAERGTDQMDHIDRFPQPKNWVDVQTAIKDLETVNHGYKTLVIDTLDWLEPVVFKAICDRYNVASIELAAGGYGKGYTVALDYWSRFIDSLQKLRDLKKMNIVVLAHADIETFTDPANEQSAYNRYIVKLHKKAAALWREAVDGVFFANHRALKDEDKKSKKLTIVDVSDRVLYTERRSGWDAKNRFAMPPMIDLKWSALDNAIRGVGSDTPQSVKDKIKSYLLEIEDPKVHAQAESMLADAKDNLRALKPIAKGLSDYILKLQGEVSHES